MPVSWRFRYYKGSPNDDVREAHDRGSTKLKARFLSRLKALAQLDQYEWGELAKPLKGTGGLYEMRFKVDGVQQRPLFCRTGEAEFTILFWATERGGKWVPRNACEVALERKKEIEAGTPTDAIWLALD